MLSEPDASLHEISSQVYLLSFRSCQPKSADSFLEYLNNDLEMLFNRQGAIVKADPLVKDLSLAQSESIYLSINKGIVSLTLLAFALVRNSKKTAFEISGQLMTWLASPNSSYRSSAIFSIIYLVLDFSSIGPIYERIRKKCHQLGTFTILC